MKALKEMLIVIAVVAVIIALHAIPALIVAIVPAWILIPLSLAFFGFLVYAACWSFMQVIRLMREGN